jgi:endonuclease YncB( thermonuclease family)
MRETTRGARRSVARGRRFLGGIAALLVFFCADAQARQPWVEWTGCSLQENDSNDGDSFHVKAGGRGYICRLYFVDAPETDAGFPERVAEQGKYFGINRAQAVQLGELAWKFTAEKLARPFTIRTCKQNAMGRSNKPRYYAFVETSEGDLGELLVANGLARVHGVSTALPGSNSSAQEERKLERLEREARKLRVGGWGGAGGMMARLSEKTSKGQPDSFDAFFHRDQSAASSPVNPAPVAPVPLSTPPSPGATTAAAVAGDKLDLNKATVTELMKIKGIGPVLAGRIIEARPFKSADELRRVKGIGPKKFAQMRPYFAADL